MPKDDAEASSIIVEQGGFAIRGSKSDVDNY